MKIDQRYNAIVIGTSAGGLFALSTILRDLPADYPIPMMAVQHRGKDQKDVLEEVLQAKCHLKIKQADEKEQLQGGTVYMAPPDYHLLVESNGTLSLSSDERVLHSRPSIDVLFESGAYVYGKNLVGIILTGASQDGAYGISKIRQMGGTTIAQDPREAQFPVMPEASIQTKHIDMVLSLGGIRNFLLNLIQS